ncbi:hypothetical protein RRG08_057189 [Elysia crispata]|uniref:Uncharacterized protein n=1 Tax=Elysia crispata TaxID=231223 RepID=A0AAE0XXG3_9GAST|nr:hypothetical protein RRG08_057189 [Elysia crispata]
MQGRPSGISFPGPGRSLLTLTGRLITGISRKNHDIFGRPVLRKIDSFQPRTCDFQVVDLLWLPFARDRQAVDRVLYINIVLSLKDRVLYINIVLSLKDRVLYINIVLSLKDRVLYINIVLSQKDWVLYINIALSLKDRVLYINIVLSLKDRVLYINIVLSLKDRVLYINIVLSLKDRVLCQSSSCFVEWKNQTISRDKKD